MKFEFMLDEDCINQVEHDVSKDASARYYDSGTVWLYGEFKTRTIVIKANSLQEFCFQLMDSIYNGFDTYRVISDNDNYNLRIMRSNSQNDLVFKEYWIEENRGIEVSVAYNEVKKEAYRVFNAVNNRLLELIPELKTSVVYNRFASFWSSIDLSNGNSSSI